MARYQVVIAYDGTAFRGMQRQVNERTVQGEIENALKAIGWDAKSILIAGRTDTGVHASGQVIAFDLAWNHSIDDLQNALNANFPQDIAACQVNQVREDFHPRYDAVSRVYLYQIYCKSTRDPLRERFAWRVWPEISLEKVETCAERLKGEYDFAAFGTPPREGGNTIRRVFWAGWQQNGDVYHFEVEGNAFLYHMVRRMVSIQIEIGQGKLEPEVFSDYLTGETTEMIQGLAPAHGLYLTKVNYADEVSMQTNLEKVNK
jgi:tRNA pseudouridine38-40 synthase